MAKKKPADTHGRADTRAVVITLKGSPEFKAWLADAAEATRTPATTIVEHALVLWAKANGVMEPPRR